ncbi:uncharacterized protein [Spinacia oleracea]|uniref:Uncharacterized protein isoform X2 n=1 Tax=Spinacia oleracea TaxID=3562 RepID=A0ABM3R517_SPIOL|nr:uncharacterized protein LOC130465950 isoform X2 [Spinacia oleracea]
MEEYDRVWAGFQKCIINNHAISKVDVSVYGVEENALLMSAFMIASKVDVSVYGVEENVLLMCAFMIAFEDLMRLLPPFVQEVVDFAALADGECMLLNDKVIEYNPFIVVARDDMWTLPSTFDILLIHIESWAFLLNENERKPDGCPHKLFLGGTYCKYVAELIEKPDDQKNLV